ncbi:hypothetical protein FE257_010389 [Aspergillus nanangensis]|uniref:Carrier domain-containing protein n=1 Tax=Aspergillus nanangensis TaxID=2582783 RepID=A0AAD4GS58_ASPNN|nr:hypothetical protein FE257_010389 [Aspergillus nanangensis]
MDPSQRPDCRRDTDPAVVVGYAVRYPQDATDAESFWEFLLQARESSTAFPPDRINSNAFYHPDPDHGGTFHTQGAHFLRDNPIGFDSAFFKMSKSEVLSLDPQHRLVMENVYHALENGMSYSGFVGSDGKCFTFDHRANGYARGEGVGTVIVKRLSTAIRDGDTIRAVIRGTGLNQDGRTLGITYPSLSAQEQLIRDTYQRAGLDTSDTCYIESHGTGTQAGDFVETSAISQAFKTKERDLPLYIGALKTNIGHLEGGSGIAGLIKTIRILETGVIPPNVNFEKPNPKISFDEWRLSLPTRCEPWPTSGLRRASVSCFGLSGTNSHCILDDACSFLKSYDDSKEGQGRDKSLCKETFPVNADRQLNSEYTRDVVQNTMTNGHVEERAPGKLFLLSGFDEDGLIRSTHNLAAYLSTNQSEDSLPSIHDLAYTLSERRTCFPWKTCILAQSMSDLQEGLSKANIQRCYSRSPPRLGFVFTGQGAQYPNMGKQLLRYQVYRESLESANTYFQTLGSSWSLLDELCREGETTRIDDPAVAHPSSTAIQIALVDLLRSWGIYPSRVVGHSSGEIAAAYCAGRISREAAWRVAYFRGQVVNEAITHAGSMMAVGLSVQDLKPYLEKVQRDHPPGVLTIACFNSPKNQTVSGDTVLIDGLMDELAQNRVFARKLNVSKAYHSAHMRVFAESYESSMGSLDEGSLDVPQQSIAMFSTCTGKKLPATKLTGSYWCENMLSPVKFQEALDELCYSFTGDDNQGEGWLQVDELLEIGTHGVLRTAIKESMHLNDKIHYNSILDRNVGDTQTALEAVAHLVSSGYPVRVSEVNRTEDTVSAPKLLVGLPCYPFNHENRVIHESRLARNLRLRPFPRHDIFGAPVQDWDPRYPKWRHFLRLGENPWLKQYKVNGEMVFPPGGFIAMAIESSLQVAEKDKPVAGILLENVALGPALALSETTHGVEITLSQHPIDNGSVRKRFHVSSYCEDQDRWTEHCSGYVTIQYQDMENGVCEATSHGAEIDILDDQLGDTIKHCQKSVDFAPFNNGLQTSNLNLGPIFHNLIELKVSGSQKGTSISVVEVPDIQAVMPKNYTHPHMIHPVTLESFLQPVMAAINDLQRDQKSESLYTPCRIEKAWVSCNISSAPGTEFKCSAIAKTTGKDSCSVDTRITSAGQCSMIVRGICYERLIFADQASADTDMGQYYSIDWQPDIHLLSNSFVDHSVQPSKTKYETELEWFTDLQLTSTLLATDALLATKGLDPSNLEPHYQRFYDLLKHIAADILTDSIPSVPFKIWQRYAQHPKLKAELFRKVEARDSDGALLLRVGSKLPSFFRKEADPLHIMFGQDDLMTRYYNDDFEIGNIPERLSLFLSLLRWNKSNLRVLEVGGGTGSFTAKVLPQLCPQDHDGSVSQYVFTDLSAGFFEKAKERLKQWNSTVSYKKLDVGVDPIAQGFEPGTFDLVLASNVLHATPDLQKTLKNIHSLLKPGGKLICHEGVRQDTLWTNISFSSLSGWWLGVEPERRWCPYISTPSWDKYLRKSGFSGLDLEFPSSHYPEFSKISVIISTARDNADDHIRVPEGTEGVVIIVPEESASPLAEIFGAQLSKLGLRWLKHTLADVDTMEFHNKIAISMLEADRPFLTDCSAGDFSSVCTTLSKVKGCLWITGNSNLDPSYAISTGFVRELRSKDEMNDSNFVVFNIGDCEDADQEIAKSMVKVFTHQFLTGNWNTQNSEYLLENGIIMANRLVPNKDVTSGVKTPRSMPQPILGRRNSAQVPLQHTMDNRSKSHDILAETISQLLRDKPMPRNLSDRVFTYSELQNAVRRLDLGSNTGAATVHHPEDPNHAQPESFYTLTQDGSYGLIGMSGDILNQHMVHLAGRGAKSIVVITDTCEADKTWIESTIGMLRDYECTVHLYQRDPSQTAASQVAERSQDHPPIRGVISCSWPLDDSDQQNPNSPSVRRYIFDLINIHESLPDLDLLIMFAPLTLTAGHGSVYLNPVCAVQDAIAHHRAASGRRAASITLGDMNAQEMTSCFDYAIETQRKPSAKSHQLIGHFPPPSFYQARQRPAPKYLADPLFLRLPVTSLPEKGNTVQHERKESMRDLLAAATDAEQAAAIVSGQIRRKLSNLLNVTEDEIREVDDIRTNGVDSLIEMEFRNWLDRELNTQIPVQDLTSQSIFRLSVQAVSTSPVARFG